MAESHVVSGLVAKRAELAGEVQRHRQELHRLADELGHLDATIRLFAPQYDLSAIRARKRAPRTQWFGAGEWQRLILEILRDAEEPLGGDALTQTLLRRKGLEDQPLAVTPVNKTAMAVLRRLTGKSVLCRSSRPNGTWVWALSGR